jgi:hypothetical protein
MPQNTFPKRFKEIFSQSKTVLIIASFKIFVKITVPQRPEHNSKDGIGQPGQANRGKPNGTRQMEQDNRDRITPPGQPREDSRGRIARAG